MAASDVGPEAVITAGVSPPVGLISARPRALFICGSINQTTQMHQIARHLPELEARYTPYYCDGYLEGMRRLGMINFTILGHPWRRDCMDYLESHKLPIDMHGSGGPYDLVVTCSDLVVPKNIRRYRLVAVQEGMTDPPGFWWKVRKVLRFLPLWSGGTAGTGLSGLYDRMCVASPGYKELFVSKGADASRLIVTGIPNFDDCKRYLKNDFPHRGYVLVCTSDTRETLKRDNRKEFILGCVARAAGRQLIFKLHPNENWKRNTREINRWAPGALVYTRGSAEEMVANCQTLIVQYSTLAFVGLALGKEVHAYPQLGDIKHLQPIQGGMAAQSIAQVCRSVLAEPLERLRSVRRCRPQLRAVPLPSSAPPVR